MAISQITPVVRPAQASMASQLVERIEHIRAKIAFGRVEPTARGKGDLSQHQELLLDLAHEGIGDRDDKAAAIRLVISMLAGPAAGGEGLTAQDLPLALGVLENVADHLARK